MQLSSFRKRQTGAMIFAASAALLAIPRASQAAQFDIFGPPGSVAFGTEVTVLPNGNFVVTDPNAKVGGMLNVGAVYLYKSNGGLISTFTGNSADDRVGLWGITVLSNGNFVIDSPWYGDAGVAKVGAVTWVNGKTGLNGSVSPDNSLVGSSADDRVGHGCLKALRNGNYVVCSNEWDGAAADVGAVTWADGNVGVSGKVSPLNSLVGSQVNDRVGSDIVELQNGNFVVSSWSWSNGVHSKAGAATWVDGEFGMSGEVSVKNSLVGASDVDNVGFYITALANGHYAVVSPFWNRDALRTEVGAVTWGDGKSGTVGEVAPGNSLTGSTTNDHVGLFGAVALSNGNYVVQSHEWDNERQVDVGAATWRDGTAPQPAIISSINSLIGGNTQDWVGEGVTALDNGNYVVVAHHWQNGQIQLAGAVTWGDGSTGTTGLVSTANSTYGTQFHDVVGQYVTALKGGNYVIGSYFWNNGAIQSAGAATWRRGDAAMTGAISASNSLVGTQDWDMVGSYYVTALSNGNFVVASQNWSNGAVKGVGATTWGDGKLGLNGVITRRNSLIGRQTDDHVGSGSVRALSNGNYVVSSVDWNRPNVGAKVGAVTWRDGNQAHPGIVTSDNSLVGRKALDLFSGLLSQADGNCVVISPRWDSSILQDAGAISLSPGISPGLIGDVTPSNSVIGKALGGGASMSVAYDPTLHRMIVGQPKSNMVSLFQ
jgi:hypothetical protein